MAELTLSAFYAVLFAVFVVFSLTRLERRIRTLSRLDAKLDALLKHAGIEFDPYEDLPDEIVQAIKRDEKLVATKLYKQWAGVTLLEAKAFIEDVQRRSGKEI